jgi:hypothetical protein
MQRMFDLLCTHQADVILNGHNHDYEQRASVDTYSEFDPKGRRQFVMGAGDHSLYEFEADQHKEVCYKPS